MDIKSISKSYGNKVVLDDISLSINKSEIVGLVGNNGAGKSTLMKIMSHNQPSFKGNVDDKSRIGYFIENPKLYENRTGLWHLKYFSSIFGERFHINKYKGILDDIGLLNVLDMKVRSYSLGMKEKLGVMISMLNDPEFVILDEPTNGMDVESSLNLLKNIKKTAKLRGIGFLISSHKLEDIEAVCDRVLFLDNCKISEEKSTGDEVIFGVTIVLKDDMDIERFTKKQKFGTILNVMGREIHLETTLGYAEIMGALKDLNIDIVDYSSEKKTLRSIYMEKFSERGYEKTI